MLIYIFSSYVMQRSKLIVGAGMLINFMTVKWNPNFSHHFAKSKLVPMIRRFKNLGVKLVFDPRREVRSTSNY